MAKTTHPSTSPTCRNCGWTGVPRDFTLDYWCDDCARAAVKTFVSTITAGVGAYLVKLVLG